MKKRSDSELSKEKWRNNSSDGDFFSKHFGLIQLAGLSVLEHFFFLKKIFSFISLSLHLVSSLVLLLLSSLLFSSLVFDLLLSLLSSLIFSSSSLVSSFISDLLFFFSGLFLHL